MRKYFISHFDRQSRISIEHEETRTASTRRFYSPNCEQYLFISQVNGESNAIYMKSKLCTQKQNERIGTRHGTTAAATGNEFIFRRRTYTTYGFSSSLSSFIFHLHSECAPMLCMCIKFVRR